MGVVYAASSHDGKSVALKILTEQHDEDALARFERERRLLSTFGSADGFVPILDAGTFRGRPFLVMPLLERGTLRSRLARGPLPLADALSVVTRVARAVGIAHARGVVHRDLKPENVLFTDEDRPLVADLGLARQFRRELVGPSPRDSLTASGVMGGTIGYMAPEQLNDAHSALPTADVFALGVVLFECLTGTRPFEGSGLLAYSAALREDPRLLDRLAVAKAESLEPVLKRCLAYEAKDRFPDAGALAQALAGPRKAPRRALVVVLAVVLGLGLLGAVLAVRRSRAAAERAAAAVRHCDEGRRRLTARDYAGARACFDAAALAAPDLPEAFAGRAEAACELAMYREAVANAERAIALSPSSSTPWRLRAWARGSLGDFDGALRDAERSVALEPRSVETRNILGVVRAWSGDYARALEELDKVVALDPKRTSFRVSRGTVRLRRNDFAGALSDADCAIEIDPTCADAWFLRASSLRNRNDDKGAEESYTKSIDLGTTDQAAWSQRATLRASRRDFAGALADCKVVLDRSPGDASVLCVRGFARIQSGETTGGREDLDRAIELEPRLARAWQLRAETRVQADDVRGAVEDFSRALELAPKDQRSLIGRGDARAKIGDTEGAREDYRKAMDGPRAEDGFRARTRLGQLPR